MKRVLLLPGLLIVLAGATPAAAQELYADFALVVQLPSYEAFLKNLGDAPIKVDGYAILSQSGSLSVGGWKTMDSAGPEIVAALGPGADGFLVANPTGEHLTELNPLSSATWQPGQSWSIGFPFNTADPDFVLDARFLFTSPDGLVLSGGTVVPDGEFAPAALLVVPEPTAAALCALAAVGVTAVRRDRRPPS